MSTVELVSELRRKLDEVYADRNLVVQALAVLARYYNLEGAKWFDGAVGTDPEEPDWPVVYVWLDGLQTSWHVPRDQLLLGPAYSGDFVRWDGHTTEEKIGRIRRWLMNTQSY